jgi:hypothetical protein
MMLTTIQPMKGHGIRKLRQQRGDKQEWRRIVPGEIADKILFQQREFDLLLDIPVVSQRRVALEHQAAGGPDIDEVGRDAQAVRLIHP